MITWSKYCDECKKWGMTNPYQDEAAFNRAYGIAEIYEPIVIVPKRSKNHVESAPKPKPKTVKKEPDPKKPKAVKEPPKPKKPKLTKEQRAEKKRKYQREYMVKWRASNPGTSYKSVKAWRGKSEENMEKHREWNRDYMRRKRAGLLPSKNGTTTTRPCVP